MGPSRTRICLAIALVAGALIPAVAGSAPAGASTQSGPSDSSVGYQGNSFHDGNVAGATASPPLLKRWTRDLGGRVSYPIVVDGRVFVTVTNGAPGYGTSVFALDAKTGQDVWGPIDLGGGYSWSNATYGEGRLFTLNFDGILQSFDGRTGRPQWIVDLPGQYAFTSPPTYRNGMVYVSGAGSGGTVYGVSAVDGSVAWMVPVEGGDHSAPAVSDAGVYVSYPCQTYDFSPLTGATIWHTNEGCYGGGGRTAVLSNGRIWTRDAAAGTPVSRSAATGALLGSYGAGPAPAFDGQTGFFLNNGVLWARNAATQAPLWSFTGDGKLAVAPLVVNGHVYIGSTSGQLWALDEGTGAPVWTDTLPSPILGPDEHNVWPLTGLGAGQGMVVVPATNLLVGYAGTPEPRVPFHPLVPARILDTRVGVGVTAGRLGAEATLTLQVAGQGGVPATGATAVVLNVTVTEPTSESFLTAWPAGQLRPLASNLNFLTGQTVPNLVTVKVGTDGKVNLFNNGGSTHVLADVAGWYGTDAAGGGAGFTALPPSRILDTRNGTGAPIGRIGPGSTLSVQVTGEGGVPASGVSAVVLNVTVTEPTAVSFLTAWPSGATRPLASNLNFVAGQTVPNLVVVKVGALGKVDLYNNAGAAHVVADVAGWYGDEPSDGAGLAALPPARILDTRDGTGAPAAKVGPGATVALQVTGQGGVPADGVTAVVLNITATQPTSVSYLTAWPGGEVRPLASNLNFAAGQTVPNLVVVKVGAGGKVNLFNNTGSTHVVADVAGWYGA